MRNFYFLFHLIGFGTLMSVIIGTLVVERYLRKSENYQVALNYLGVISKIGLLSPIAVLIILISGIGLMTLYGYGIFTAGWLTAKLLVFVVMALTGGYSAINIGKKRRQIYEDLASGRDNPKLPGELLRMHNRQNQYILIQSIFLLMILIFTVYKPS